MKLKITFSFIFLLFLSGFSFAQSCCSLSSAGEFALLGNNPEFIRSHASPLPFTFKPETGKFVTFKSPDGKDGRAFEVKGTGNKVLLMFHEWWGINDYMQQEAERLQKELGTEVTILTVDLFDGKVTSNPDTAGKLTKNAQETRLMNIIKGAITYAGPSARIGTIGWCFGGGWALQAFIQAGKQGDACVMYYGMPEKDKEKIKKINGPVLGLFAKQDKWITPQVVNDFEKSMKAEGKSIQVKSYDADHAFANPSNPKYNKEAGDDAHKLAMEFLMKNLCKK